MKPVTSLDIFDGNTQSYHEHGLFSTQIFGRIGDAQRDTQFAYIDLNTYILHPVIFNNICKLKAFYKEIMAGNAYAIWDKELLDFVPSTIDVKHAQTGFSFFISKLTQINFKRNSSIIRDTRIGNIEKYMSVAKIDKVTVLPAGLRDYEVDDTGATSEDECNGMYRKLIAISNLIGRSHDPDDSALDNSRYKLQLGFNDIYHYFENILSGKRGFAQDKFASRKLFYGTRNVITAIDTSSPFLGKENPIKLTDTIIGLYQQAKAIEPFTRLYLKQTFIEGIFFQDGSANLVNPKSLKQELVKLSAKTYNLWNSDEGLTRVITTLSDVSIAHQPVMVDGHYLALIYKGPDSTFKIMHSIDEMENTDRDVKDVSPITYIEMLYLAGYKDYSKYPNTVTRYPIAKMGSIYPASTYLKTTIKSEKRIELDVDWTPKINSVPDEHTAWVFPIKDTPVFVSMSPHVTRLADLNADNDGDMCNYNGVMTKEAIEEINESFTKAETFLRMGGGFKTSSETFLTKLLLRATVGLTPVEDD